MITPERTVKRFWAKVDRSADENACWLWATYTTKDGYGKFWDGVTSRHLHAHIYSYELANGDRPKGDNGRYLTIDHDCHTTECPKTLNCPHRKCVNPAHLIARTIRENSLRGKSPAADKARQTHCDLGHPLSGDNLRIRSDGHRICLDCLSRRSREAYARKKIRQAPSESEES